MATISFHRDDKEHVDWQSPPIIVPTQENILRVRLGDLPHHSSRKRHDWACLHEAIRANICVDYSSKHR
jgi:hypothetical protein